MTALGLALLSVLALGAPASAATYSFRCTPQVYPQVCGKAFAVPSGKSVWVNFKSSGYMAGFKAYNKDGDHYLGKTEAAYSGNVRLWFNNTNRTIRVQVRASVLVGGNGAVSGTYWVG
ncbi:hypothetical protein [Allokutzneria sp. NRRL B-24872]|uniref:hypothetical protein n=1 Tax=Allokutzneria sp. NRRL B-24872 TaxID=1137961 RepID=UPI000A37B129|nr:hypothetical protein [Allokutzneria sp. NRRL B-24872]